MPRAVPSTLRPLYPPNLLALAEALAKTGDPSGARESYARARDAALALPAARGQGRLAARGRSGVAAQVVDCVLWS